MKRNGILVTLVIALLCTAALCSRQHMLHCRQRAEIAQEALGESCRTVAAIADIRNRPVVAADGEAMAGEIQTAIESAAADAGIATGQLVRISPLPAQRLGDSAYREKPTHVRLEEVTLRQMVTMLHRLAAENRGLVTKSIQIRSSGGDVGDLWIAETELTYLIYDPAEAGR